MKRMWMAITLMMAVSACTRSGNETPDPNAAIIAEIKRQIAELERNSTAEIADFKHTLDSVSRESKSAANDLQQQILLKDERIAGLETRIQELRREMTGLKQAGENKTSENSPNPLPVQTSTFPVRVFEAKGLKVVTGQHTTVRQVETDKIEKDMFGDKVKQTRPESFEEDEYGYKAGFSVENPTASPVEVSFSAGSGTETVVVPAGQIVSNLTVDSAVGADLVVEVGGYTRRYPLTY